MSDELNKELKKETEKPVQDVEVTEEELADFEINDEEMNDVSGGMMPAFVRADYPNFFAKNS